MELKEEKRRVSEMREVSKGKGMRGRGVGSRIRMEIGKEGMEVSFEESGIETF